MVNVAAGRLVVRLGHGQGHDGVAAEQGFGGGESKGRRWCGRGCWDFARDTKEKIKTIRNARLVFKLNL